MSKPLHAHLLDRLTETIGPMQAFARTVPDAALVEELRLLRSIPDVTIAHRAMAAIYAEEQQRRHDPELAFDDELDAALSRLERNTSAEDRHRVHEIGMQVATIDRTGALRRAYRRMMDRGRPSTKHIRAKIMQARWAGITGESLA